MPPSLHAGLIERGRARSVAPGPVPVLRTEEMPEPLAVLTPVKPRTPRLVASEAVVASGPTFDPVRVPSTVRMPGLGRRRRFGLTVRVSPETREILDQLREETGQTFQQILNCAVTGYLERR